MQLVITRLSWFFIFSAFFSLENASAKQYPGIIALTVDASDTLHRIFHVTQRIPVEPGPFTLWYPKWRPGEHGPSNRPTQIAGLFIKAHGKIIEFKRDPIDMYAFHLNVPQGSTHLDLSFDVITIVDKVRGRVMSPTTVQLKWISTALYPAGYEADKVQIQASLKIPSGWTAFSALEVASRNKDTTHYKTTDFDTLLDSPVFAGKYSKTFDLDPGAATPVRLNVVAEDPRFLEVKDEHLKAHRALIQQAYKLFGSKHYDHYDFLFALTNNIPFEGVEHHRSSENVVGTTYFTEWDPKANGSDLLPHEFTHSWNGKFRRPADLSTRHFNDPMGTSLLWVYEGQTSYWGNVLAGRSGLRNLDSSLEALAITAATYAENRPGFAWRSLQDTVYDPIMRDAAAIIYPSWQLQQDYYRAAAMMWLEIDVLLRSMSNGTKSLDDFARNFFGMQDGSFGLSTYVFDDVVKTLNNLLLGHDFETLLKTRLNGHGSFLSGLEASGWRLVFTDKPTETQKAIWKQDTIDGDYLYSLGIVVDKDGNIKQVRWDSPAFRMGVAVGMTLVAVNSRQYNKDYLDDAIRNAQKEKSPIKLLVKDFDVFRNIDVDYHGGLRYPRLERVQGKPDYLTPIFTARL